MDYNITKEAIIEAIERIDNHPELLKGRQSYMYDLLYHGKDYPPILVLSEANKLMGGAEMTLKAYGSTEAAFKILRDLGFEIKNKSQGKLKESLVRFAEIYDVDRKQKFHSSLESYQIVCKDIPQILKENITADQDNLKIQGSIGQGNFANYPWIGIFNTKVSTGATVGYYIVLLISDDLQQLYLTLNQGSTIQSKEEHKRISNYIYSVSDTIPGFVKGKLPEGSLVVNLKKNNGNKNGKKYEETNLFYRAYDINKFDESDFYQHLNKLVMAYQNYVHSAAGPDTINTAFSISSFYDSLTSANLNFSKSLVQRFVGSLLAKRFLLLSGLSGSGKTKIAQAFAQWLAAAENQYKIVPVGADWTNREPLLGYANGLNESQYITPENGVLQLLIEANDNADLPYFLILDEMNLSHVERYFADFLSVMESKDTIKLYTGLPRLSLNGQSIPTDISWPSNLFVIGTVNIDETTYMFSPKVLDRANVIEFRLKEDDLSSFLSNPIAPNLQNLSGKGTPMATSYLDIAQDKNISNIDGLSPVLISFFNELSVLGSEFGYRTAHEIALLITKLKETSPELSSLEHIDIAIMQKLLPKLHGSRAKIVKVLHAMAKLCLEDASSFKMEDVNKEDFITPVTKYPISFEKLVRMYRNVIANGFTSYSEA